MASIKYSGLISGMQGKLNGSVLSRSRSGAVLYQIPRQRKEPTSSQLGIRAGFSTAAYYWSSLDQSQRDDWDSIAQANPVPNRFGDLMPLTGFAYFKKMMQLYLPYGSPAPLVADTSAAAPYEFTPDSASADWAVTDQGYILSNVMASAVSINDSAAANQWNLYISLPVKSVYQTYFRTWYLIGQGVFDASLGASAPLVMEIAEKLMPSGWRTFEGAYHLVKAISFIPDRGVVSVEQIWDIVLTGGGPEPVPFFGFGFYNNFAVLYYTSPDFVELFPIGVLDSTDPVPIGAFWLEVGFTEPTVSQVSQPVSGWVDTDGWDIAQPVPDQIEPVYSIPTQGLGADYWSAFGSDLSGGTPKNWYWARMRLRRKSDNAVSDWEYSENQIYYF